MSDRVTVGSGEGRTKVVVYVGRAFTYELSMLTSIDNINDMNMCGDRIRRMYESIFNKFDANH